MPPDLELPEKAFPPAWKTYRLFGFTLSSDFLFANRLMSVSGAPDVTFTCVEQSPVANNDWERKVPAYASPYLIDDGESLLCLYRLDTCDLLRFTRIADFYLWPDRIVCHLLK